MSIVGLICRCTVGLMQFLQLVVGPCGAPPAGLGCRTCSRQVRRPRSLIVALLRTLALPPALLSPPTAPRSLLQTLVDSAIVQVQEYTANPRTDASLGKVGY